MKYFVTGCVGFIGSNLTDRFLADGHTLTDYDNFSALQNPSIQFARGDVLDFPALTNAKSGVDFVFHLASNVNNKRVVRNRPRSYIGLSCLIHRRFSVAPQKELFKENQPIKTKEEK